MATHKELYSILGDEGFKDRLFTACLIEFNAIYTEPGKTLNHSIKLVWYERFSSALQKDNNPIFKKILWMFVAKCKNIALADIRLITDVMLNDKVEC